MDAEQMRRQIEDLAKVKNLAVEEIGSRLNLPTVHRDLLLEINGKGKVTGLSRERRIQIAGEIISRLRNFS